MSVDKILSEIKAGSEAKGPQCTVAVVLATLKGEERDALDAALADQTIQLVAISRWLRKNGHDAKPHTLSRHRRQECRCE